jgi:TonB family protein
MRRLGFSAALLATITAPGAIAEQPTPIDIVNARFLQQPNGRDFVENYPEVAAAQTVEGRARIECFVELDTTTTCRVMEETPAGWGFGVAALEIARSFRVAPATVNGVPTRGGRIRRTIRFVLPENRGRRAAAGSDAMSLEMPELDLPAWDEAPNFYAVLDAYPAEARRDRTEGRAILSCTTRADRRLNCRNQAEMPAGRGFGPAALRLAPQFRIAEGQDEFIARYRQEPFVLPIFFGTDLEEMPTDRYNAGEPLRMPVVTIPEEYYPTAARDAGIEGRVVAMCTLRAQPSPSCVVLEESPSGHGFGPVVAATLSASPFSSAEPGVLVGDQIRFEILFELP